MKLFASLASPYTRKVRIVLAEKKIEFEMELVDVYLVENPVNAPNPQSRSTESRHPSRDTRCGQRNCAQSTANESWDGCTEGQLAVSQAVVSGGAVLVIAPLQ